MKRLAFFIVLNTAFCMLLACGSSQGGLAGDTPSATPTPTSVASPSVSSPTLAPTATPAVTPFPASTLPPTPNHDLPHADIACELVADGGECDVLLTANGQLYSLADQNLAGNTICVVPSDGTKGFSIDNVQGAAGDPVVITNCDGQVVLDTAGWTTGIGIQNSRYIKFSGMGSSAHTYGFLQVDSNDRGMEVATGSSDIEVSYVEIRNSGNAALTMRTYPFLGNGCLYEYSRENFTQYNTIVHHVKIDGAGAEGMYIGTSHYHLTGSEFCPGIEEISLVGVRIYENQLFNISNDGIQLGGAISDVEVYNNTVIDYAIENNSSHGGGLQINPGTNGKFYNNYLKSAPGATASNAVQYAGGEGSVFIYNNVFVGSPNLLMSLNKMDNNTSLHILNNTFIGDASGSIFYFFCNVMNGVQDYEIKNNIISNYGAVGSLVYADQHSYFNGGNGTNCPINGSVLMGTGTQNQLKISGNQFVEDVSAVKFINEADDNYNLMSDSPAVDAGEDFSHIFVDDKDGKVRNQPYDFGAYEYLP